MTTIWLHRGREPLPQTHRLRRPLSFLPQGVNMNALRCCVQLGLLLIVVAAVGCTDGGRAAFRKENPDNFSGIIADSQAVQQASLDDINSGQTDATLASTKLPREKLARSLRTLPKGSDLGTFIGDAQGPVLLDFFADWCGPCKVQGKILHDLEEVAASMQTQIIKINVDDHPEIAKELRISSLPTLIMLRDGKVVERQSGVAKKRRLLAWMK